MLSLGIETSCDETAVSILDINETIKNIGKSHNATSSTPSLTPLEKIYSCNILSSIIKNNLSLHASYGGVYPKYAARDHVRFIKNALLLAMEDANVTLKDIDLISVTTGPGLIGSLLIGSIFARTIAACTNKNIIGVNHLESHALSPMMHDKELQFPFLLLLLSGGHTLLVHVKNIGDYDILGQTLDDAVGEVLDKVGRAIGCQYPAGSEMEKMAEMGNACIELPSNILRNEMNFSFSGIKTATLNMIDKYSKYDIVSSLQKCIADTLLQKTLIAVNKLGIRNIVLAGGVASNQYIRSRFIQFFEDCKIYFPELSLCTDNGAMVAYAGALKVMQNNILVNKNLYVNPRWSIDYA